MLTDTGVPKHVQLRDLLLADIGDRAPGELIESERDLMRAHGVSRATVRAAIGSLVAAGRLRKVHGKGTVVTRPRVESRLHLASFTQDMRRRGHRPTTTVLGLDVVAPPPTVASALGLAGGAPAWRLERLRLADDEPMAHELSYYPHDLLPGLDAEPLDGSVYALFAARYGVVVDGAGQVAWSDLADRDLADLLGVRRPASVLVFERVSSAAEVPVEHTTSAYRGDRYQIQMDLGRGPHHDQEGSA